MEDKIIEILSMVSKVSISDLKSKADEKCLWDSLKHIEIVLSLEEEFEITFENEDIANAKTVNALIDTVKKKVK